MALRSLWSLAAAACVLGLAALCHARGPSLSPAAPRPAAPLASATPGAAAASAAAGTGHAAAAPPEPPALAAFMAAYARGDEATAERVASPLYGAEWARRGLTVAERVALLPRRRAGPAASEWLRFTYRGGAVTASGFGHHLYTALPTRPLAGGERPIPSVWRVDTAPDGRVIWLELVWLFADGTARLTPISGAQEVADLPLPPALAALQPRLLMGVRSDVGLEGYYALGPGPQASGDQATTAPGVVLFLAIDPDGSARRGAWSYGQPEPGPIEYGTPATPPRQPPATLEPGQLLLHRAYLASLP